MDSYAYLGKFAGGITIPHSISHLFNCRYLFSLGAFLLLMGDLFIVGPLNSSIMRAFRNSSPRWLLGSRILDLDIIFRILEFIIFLHGVRNQKRPISRAA